MVKRLALARGYAIEGLEVRAAEKLNILRVVDAVHLLLLAAAAEEAAKPVFELGQSRVVAGAGRQHLVDLLEHVGAGLGVEVGQRSDESRDERAHLEIAVR